MGALRVNSPSLLLNPLAQTSRRGRVHSVGDVVMTHPSLHLQYEGSQPGGLRARRVACGDGMQNVVD